MKTPHKHAAIIKAWADGAGVEVDLGYGWVSCPTPSWVENYSYRVKPERVFPKTSLSPQDLLFIHNAAGNNKPLRAVADAAVKQYILNQEAQGFMTDEGRVSG